MDRRAFFRLGRDTINDVADKALKLHIDTHASQWIRPPFAATEAAFLDACTQCGDCMTACPHSIIFPIPTQYGEEFSGTPILDLVTKGCHLCEGWPCVSACETGALSLTNLDSDDAELEEVAECNGSPQTVDLTINESPKSEGEGGDEDDEIIPVLAIATIDIDQCITFMGPECGACQSVCPVPGAIDWNMNQPTINQDICVGCALCREACITEPKAIIVESLNRIPSGGDAP